MLLFRFLFVISDSKSVSTWNIFARLPWELPARANIDEYLRALRKEKFDSVNVCSAEEGGLSDEAKLKALLKAPRGSAVTFWLAHQSCLGASRHPRTTPKWIRSFRRVELRQIPETSKETYENRSIYISGNSISILTQKFSTTSFGPEVRQTFRSQLWGEKLEWPRKKSHSHCRSFVCEVMKLHNWPPFSPDTDEKRNISWLQSEALASLPAPIHCSDSCLLAPKGNFLLMKKLRSRQIKDSAFNPPAFHPQE